MPNDERTTGTADDLAQGGNGDEPTGTAPADSADGNAGAEQDDELERLRREKQQWLAEKSTLERTKAELRALKSQTPPTTAATTREEQFLADLQRDIAENQALADRDPAARLALKMLRLQEHQWQEQEKTRRAMKDETELAAVDPGVRDEVRREYATGLYASPEAAMWAVLGKSASQKQRELALKEEELRRERAAREAGERAAAPRPVLGEGSKVATITEADYKRRMEQNDAETYRAVESGRLRVLWGK